MTRASQLSTLATHIKSADIPIESFSAIEAVLEEAIHSFKKKSSRSNAIQLMVLTTMCWKMIRAHKKISGTDMDWLARDFIPADNAYIINTFGMDLFENEKKFIQSLHEVYQLHTFIRHPNPESPQAHYFFDAVWPEDINNKILDVAIGCSYIAGILSGNYGWSK